MNKIDCFMHSCSFYIIAALCINVKESKLIGKLIAVLWDTFKYSYIPLTNMDILDVCCKQIYKDTWLNAGNAVNWMIFVVQITKCIYHVLIVWTQATCIFMMYWSLSFLTFMLLKISFTFYMLLNLFAILSAKNKDIAFGGNSSRIPNMQMIAQPFKNCGSFQ